MSDLQKLLDLGGFGDLVKKILAEIEPLLLAALEAEIKKLLHIP